MTASVARRSGRADPICYCDGLISPGSAGAS